MGWDPSSEQSEGGLFFLPQQYSENADKNYVRFIKCVDGNAFRNFFYTFAVTMARIVCLDYGIKRCGLATTDPLQIIVTGLDTVETKDIYIYFKRYLTAEIVEKLVIGLPVHQDGNFTYLKSDIDKFVVEFSEKWPNIKIDYADEQFSSVHAKQIILDSGANKKKRQDKALVDKISAVIILQRYLKHI